MYDQDGTLMTNVGFVGKPWTVMVYMTDIVGSDNPAVDGTTTVEFIPAVGTATFDNLVIQGNVEQCTFTFTVNNPAENGVIDVKSDVVTFFPPRKEIEGECTEDEGIIIIILIFVIFIITKDHLSTKRSRGAKHVTLFAFLHAPTLAQSRKQLVRHVMT